MTPETKNISNFEVWFYKNDYKVCIVGIMIMITAIIVVIFIPKSNLTTDTTNISLLIWFIITYSIGAILGVVPPIMHILYHSRHHLNDEGIALILTNINTE